MADWSAYKQERGNTTIQILKDDRDRSNGKSEGKRAKMEEEKQLSR